MIITLTLFWMLFNPAAATASVSADIQTNTQLSRVTGVTVQDITDATAVVRWSKHAKALKYQVRVKQGTQVVTKTKTTRRRLALSDLSADTTYTVQVRALRGQKLGKWSQAIEFATTAAESPYYDDYKAVAGDFSGSWQNLTFGTSGDTTTSVEIDPDGRAAFTLDLGGFVFGLLDPAAKTYESTYDESGVVFTAEDDDLFGDLTITIVSNGNDTAQITFTGVDVPVAGIDSITADGTLYSDSLDMDYQITLEDTTLADGIFNLTKTE